MMVPIASLERQLSAAWRLGLTRGSVAVIKAVEPLGLVIHGPVKPRVLSCVERDKL